MPNPKLNVDENDPHAVAEECVRVAGLRPREIPSIAYIQKLLTVAAGQITKGRRRVKRTNDELTAGI